MADAPVAILGAGNIGRALACGWAASGARTPEQVVLTRRRTE
ncbi:MAG: NAD(P)-binding domain-containing protein, partial [Longimicrobiales bacterium]